MCLVDIFVKSVDIYAKLGLCFWCSNNAMSLWSKIKGKETEFKGPPAVGQVFEFI